MTLGDMADLKAALEQRAETRTHWADCYLDARHRDCAIQKLLDEIEEWRRRDMATGAALDQLQASVDGLEALVGRLME